MQDIVFYAVANETLGVVRDYANAKRKRAPILALGVSVCLRMRLFAEPNNAAPYPIDSFSAVTNWQWRMDDDFDRSTVCKLVADADGISVHTVTDTIDGETMDFTEFVIPISNMNTEELAAWIGSGKTRSGLTGELVGYDALEQAVFVLQIENFTVRNRVGGLFDPTALDQETVTRSQAEQMIQMAVSSSAATKQDKLSASNGGTGIAVSNAGVISVSEIPQSAVTGLTTSLNGLSSSLAGKQDGLTAGYRTALVNGSTVDQARYFAIESSITAAANQTTTIVLSAGKAYEIHAVASNAKVLLNREEPVGGNHTFGLEGHLEIFVARTGYVIAGTNVVLANALEPDAVNNCTVRFHDGLAIISVEDHVAGYIVVSATGSTEGTLPYALSSASQNYIAFDASLNGMPLDMGGAVANGEKHIVGNGYADTILTGGVSCASKTTFANLAMSGVVVSGGTMTLGDVYIPDGATVNVSSEAILTVENVRGNGGGTIDLSGSHIYNYMTPLVASGCVFQNGSNSGNGGAVALSYTSGTFTDCLFLRNKTTGTIAFGGAVTCNSSAVFSNCVFSSNTCQRNANAGALYGRFQAYHCTFKDNSGAFFLPDSTCLLSDCYLGSGQNGLVYGGSAILTGSNTILSTITGGSMVVSSGTILDFTGNTNANVFSTTRKITISGGQFGNPTAFVFSSGGISGSRTFEDLEIYGSAITNLGLIYGATVYSFAGDDHEIVYTTDAGATSSSVVITGETAYVVTGALMKVSNT